MKRRHVLGVAAGVLGGSTLFGTSAFNVARADREVEVEVVPDEDSYLSLKPLGSGGRSSGGQSLGDEEIVLRFPGPDWNDHPLNKTPGLGTDSVYEFTKDKDQGNAPEGLIEVRNQGTETIEVTDDQVTDGQGGTGRPDVGLFDVAQEPDPFRPLLREEPVTLNPGEAFRIGVQIDTHGVEIGGGEGPEGQYLETVQFVANAIDN